MGRGDKLTELLRASAVGRGSVFLVCISPAVRVVAVVPRALFLKGMTLLICRQAAALRKLSSYSCQPILQQAMKLAPGMYSLASSSTGFK